MVQIGLLVLTHFNPKKLLLVVTVEWVCRKQSVSQTWEYCWSVLHENECCCSVEQKVTILG